jgi:hypothetical protein
MLPVIIRKWQGEIIALFPTLPAHSTGYDVVCWAWHGGHSSANLQAIIAESTPATTEEVDTMLGWLSGTGYMNLRVYKRYQAHMLETLKENQRTPNTVRLGREFTADYTLVLDTVQIIETLQSIGYQRSISGIHCMMTKDNEVWIHHGSVPYDDSLYERLI